jgi:hypothetical protein
MSQSLTTQHFGRDPVAARADGFQCLSPVERQFAIEFVVSAGTLKAMAAQFGLPIPIIQRMYNDPVVRAFIADLQAEVLQHRLVNEQWVEGQIMRIWPQLVGEEPVALVDKCGNSFEAKKFHSTEVTSILKHFGGNTDQKKVGGVNVQINFGAMGVLPPPEVKVNGYDQS